MVLISQMIRIKRLNQFITELVHIRNEELDEKAQWEFWLHKEFEKPFDEFMQSIKGSQAEEQVSDRDQIEIVNQSRHITSSFVPPEERR